MVAPGLEPTAQGAFAKTPLPHLFVYALERALHGTFELRVGTEALATVLFVRGGPAKVRTTAGVHFLGEVMRDLGLVTQHHLVASLERRRETPRLQGQILIELGACDVATLEAGLRAQLERKLEYLFSLPAETAFDYYDGVDGLQQYGGPPTPIDPLPVLWRGVRQAPTWEHVDGTLKRVGNAGVRVAANAQIERFLFDPGEAAAVELLRERPLRVVELANAKVIEPRAAQLLVYALVITKQVDLVEVSARLNQTGPALSDPASASSANQPLSQTAQPQAFARVQLQARQVSRTPIVVEEVLASMTNRGDGRIASPIPPVQSAAPRLSPIPPAVPLDLGLGIGGLISQSIHASPPPPLAAVSAERPPPGAQSVPQPPPASVTVEQHSLKQKILTRAAQITSQDYFQMLSLGHDATPEMVNKAFLQLAKVWHPDRLPPALFDVQDACSKVFTYLTEANATLMDAKRREQYMRLLKDGGATPDDQQKIHSILDAATQYQKAEFHLKRNEVGQALELAKQAHALDAEQAEYIAMIAWIEAQKPEWSGRDKTLEKIAVLDRCLKTSPNCERAYFWRGLLYKRIDELSKATKDFRKCSELNPRNLDAMREVRLYTMRGGSKPPPAGQTGSIRPPGNRSSKPPPPETLSGLFGRLFKK